MADLIRNLRLAVRSLSRSPLIFITAVTTLAIGIASTTIVFSIVNSLMLQPLRYGNPERVVLVWMARRHTMGYGNPQPEVYVRWRERARSFIALAALADRSFDLRGDPPVRIAAAEATANFFAAVEVRPILGRVFTAEEARDGARLVVLSYPVWKNRFASDPQIAGKTVVLSGEPWTVIGVMPLGFSFIRNHDLWVPLHLSGDSSERHNPLMPVAKLQPGVTMAQASGEMDAIQQQIIRELPDVRASTFDSARVMQLREVLLGGTGRILIMIKVLMGAGGFVLVIACVNVSNLLQARGAARQKEIAVRVSLGATRGDIVRQLLAEAAVLAGLGAAVGLILAFAVVTYLATLPILQAPGAPPVSVDPTVLAFLAVITVLTVIVSGVLPAWQISHISPIDTLKSTSSATLGSSKHSRVRSTLVIAEVSLSMVLLVLAGVFLRRFIDLLHVNPGFDPTNVLTMDISRTRQTSPRAARNFYCQVLERIQPLPGVEAAAVSTTLPMVGWNYGVSFRRPDQSMNMLQRQYGMLNVVSPGYFEVLRLPVLRGRAFDRRDTASSLPVAIIDQHLARRYFKDEDPAGKTLIVAGPLDSKAEVARQIVGIAGDVKDSGIEHPIADDVYLPFDQYPVPWEYLSVRGRNVVVPLTASIREAIGAVDPDQPLEDIATMTQRIDDSLGPSRFATRLLAGFAFLSLLLAAIGVYGVIAHSTAQRTAEFGLRMALGARPAALARFAMKRGVKLAVNGAMIGVPVAVVFSRVLSNTIAGINTTDPLVFVTAFIVIMSVALLAVYVPARRAAQVDPLMALREE